MSEKITSRDRLVPELWSYQVRSDQVGMLRNGGLNPELWRGSSLFEASNPRTTSASLASFWKP
jgi:hypothetical protein